MNMGHPRLLVGEPILFIHAQRTVIYSVVIVSRILERTDENDGFKMAALQYRLNYSILVNSDIQCKSFARPSHSATQITHISFNLL